MAKRSEAKLDADLVAKIIAKCESIPIFHTLGFHTPVFESGVCTATVPYNKQYDGVFESFHGGILMTIADSIACCALMTLTGPDEPMATTDMNIRFLARCVGDVTAKATVIKCGRTLCPIHVDLHDAEGKHIAVSQVTYIRLGAG
ncbi:MAG: PaaI family thioesterase [Planctomycetes bacterium]|nr:PaaI family thioesterase [Planctomycetota bacterium]NUQ34479.1 PaaI family thioesterase [Planctomycetaceae bacterium]